MKHTITFLTPFDEFTLEAMDTNLSYISADIIHYKINLQEITLELKESCDVNKLEMDISDLIKKIKPLKDISSKTLFSQQDLTCNYTADVFQELVNTGEVFVLQDGMVALSGIVLKMFEEYDKHIVEFSNTQNAKKALYPVTTHFDNLLPTHYFQRTPQHALFISPLTEDAKNISDFSKLVTNETPGSNLSSYLKQPQSTCRSAVCLNCYPTLRNKTLGANENLCFTTEGRVFRHEYKKVTSLERLYEFSVRDIIYVGTKEYVKKSIKECERWYIDFLTKFKLNSCIKSASDPFFLDNSRALQFFQVAEDSKYEIRVLNPFTNNQISIGSLNFHGNHFSKAYNIKNSDGEFSATGCVGFGLERTVFTVLAQYGTKYKEWPAELIEFFNMGQFNG
jgi:hypothetical protein